MNSKIQKNQILIKGVTILILSIMIFSCLSVAMISFAADGESETIEEPVEENIETDEYLEYDTDSKYESLEANIEEIVNQLKNLDEQVETKYNNFSKYIKENTTINISSELELRMLSIYVNQESDCTGKTFNITKNIQLTNSIEWEPIGNSINKFKGILDGLGHTISGINISIKRSYAGLVGYLGQGGTVKNIRVANSSISIPPELKNEINDLKSNIRVGYEALGAVVGCAEGATITNCVNETEVIGGNAVGGIVGKVITYDNSLVSKVEYCRNEGTIKGFQGVGGIIGDLQGYYSSNDLEKQSQVLNCYNKGTIFGIAIDIGGIVGISYGNSRVENCLNEGDVSAPVDISTYMILGKNTTIVPQNIGGIVGGAACMVTNGNATITKNINKGSVYGCADVGGIAGHIGTTAGGNAYVKYCINYSTDVSASERYGKFMGGIAGRIGAVDINGNYSEGNVQDCICALETFLDDEAFEARGIYPIYKNKEDEENDNVLDSIIISLKDIRRYEDSGKSYYGYITGFVYNKSYNESSISNIEIALNSKLPIHNNKYLYATANYNDNVKAYDLGYWEDMTLKSTNENIENNLTLDDNQYVIDNTKPTILSIDVMASTGTSMASKGDTLLFEVKFNEKVNYTRINPSISFNIGTVNCAANLTKIEDFATGSKATYTYTIGSGNSGRISDILVNDSYIWDIFENKIDSNISTAKITNNILIVDKTDDSVTYTKSNGSGEDQWTVTYTVTGGQYRNGRRYFIGTNGDNAITITAIIDKQISIANGSSGNPTIKLKIGDTYVDVDEYTEVSGSRYQTNDTAFSTKIECKYYSTETSPEGELKDIYIEDNRNINLSYNSTSQVPSLTDGFTQSNTSPENVEGVYRDTTAPSLKLAMSPNTYYGEGDKIIIKATSSEELDGTMTIENAPILTLSFGDSDAAKGTVKCTSIQKDENNNTVIIYEYQVVDGDNGKIKVNFVENSEIADLAGNISNLYKENGYTINEYVDTKAPTLDITAKKVVDTTRPDILNNVTNADTLEYTFTWSEKVIGFEQKDITVINGTAGTLSEARKNDDGTYSYTMNIKPNVAPGNEGQVQVIVEANVCKDLVNLTNTRTESIIRVDKKAPRLISLEAYAASDIALDKDIDIVKENYRIGEEITIVATFDENIVSLEENVTGLPELALQFSESGNAKGTVSGIPEGNKIIYTYKIVSEDEGTLSVKGFTGTVVDAAGNETRVTKRALDGDTIIADTKLPTLQALNVTSNKIENKATEKITIEAVYDEEVYALITKEDGTKEIVNITNENAPKLNLSFVKEDANGTSIEVEAKGEMTAQYAENDKTRIIYTYTVAGEEEAGDNGKLKINDLVNNENAQVCDIAGNTSENNTETKTTKDVLADTIRPQVSNITASVENPRITNTGIYHKEGNTVKITLTFDEKVSGAVLCPTIQVGFSEIEGQEPETYNDYAYESDWNVNSKTIEYSYAIKAGDNGYLWVKVPEGQFKDVAWNTNVAKEATQVSNIFADTTKPIVTLLRDTTVEQNNQKITIKAQFSENVYDLKDESRVTLENENAPKLIYSFGTGTTNKEIGGSVSGSVITYVITKDPVNDNGTLHYELAKGNLCDRAGNEYYQETTDTTAPILEEVVISSNAGMYDPYCKAGTEIYVTATFDEAIAAKNIKLKATIGDVEITELNGESVAENSKQIRFTYTVKAGDTGIFEIIDICGEIDNQITGENADNTYGWVRDEKGNQNNIYSLADEGITPTGEAEADTKAPYITSIKAKVNDKEIATYTKEEGKDAVITVGRTNTDTIEYIVTYSENITLINEKAIEMTNGKITKIKVNDTDKTQLIITVKTTTEGVQSLIIPKNVVEDIAGNTNEFFRFNGITVDFTKPTVRFISEYNGGIYVLPTNIGKVEIRPNVEISEDIATIEYKWDDGEYKPIENYSSSSDIAIPTKAFTEAGEYVLSIRVKDLAGNVVETSKKYTVKNSNIDIELSTYEYTNQDIIATVSFGNGLTDNRKVIFKAEGSNELIELNAKGTNEKGIEYTIGTNGTIYAEATDKVGNKVFYLHEIETEEGTKKEIGYTITKIDKENPIVELSLDGANLVIGTGKDKATVKTTVKTNEPTTIKYAWEGTNESESEVWKDNWQTSEKDISELDLGTTSVAGRCYLNIIATDKAGNETEYKSLPFNVANSNIVKDDEGNIVSEPAEENTIKFERQQQFIYVTYGSTLSEEKNVTFTNEDDGYVLDGYAQVLKPTTVTATASDVCGNTVIATYVVESVEGPKFEVIGNPKDWTNQDVKLEVSTYDALKALTVNGEDILSKEENIRSNIVVSENGDYEFIATDTYGNISKKTVKVEKIDKGLPVISKVENEGKDITITATDELSGIAEYAITSTTETPVEWSKSNVIKTTKDGTFYVWAKDNAGNISRAENVIVVDTTAPTITFNYNSLTVNVGGTLETNITTDEDAIISYSWDNQTWTSSEDYVRSQKVVKTPTATGNYTLYAKATDKSSNESKVQTLEFTVIKAIEEVQEPEIIFEDLATIQVNGVKYVKISAGITTENLTSKMNKEALLGKTPEYTKLTSDNKLKTGSEITINDEIKYVIVVNGDVDCDGKVTFLGDVVMANNYRIGQVNLSTIQKLAADINNSGTIEFIPDIVAMNNYRLGIINSL